MRDRYCFAFLETIACFLASHSFVSSLFSFQGTPGGGRFAYSVPRGSFLRIFHRCSFLAACGGVSSSCSRFCIAGYKDGEMPPAQLVGSSGLEPPTSRLSGVRSNHLSYEPIYVAVRGPAIPAYLCNCCFSFRLLFSQSDCGEQSRRNASAPAVVEMNRIELSTPCLQGRCSPS